MSDYGFRVSDKGFMISGARLTVKDLVRVYAAPGLESRVQNFGFRVGVQDYALPPLSYYLWYS